MSQPRKVVIVGGGFRSSHQRPHARKHSIGGQFQRQRLGHPEIDNLWRGVAVDFGHEDVRWFQVAADNGFLMSVLDALAHVHKQFSRSRVLSW